MCSAYQKYLALFTTSFLYFVRSLECCDEYENDMNDKVLDRWVCRLNGIGCAAEDEDTALCALMSSLSESECMIDDNEL